MADLEHVRRVALNSYDIRPQTVLCNFPRCHTPPSIRFEVFEFTLRRNSTIATLHLCDDHINSTDALMKMLRKSFPDIVIHSKEHVV